MVDLLAVYVIAVGSVSGLGLLGYIPLIGVILAIGGITALSLMIVYFSGLTQGEKRDWASAFYARVKLPVLTCARCGKEICPGERYTVWYLSHDVVCKECDS
ncbi:MAG TPA: hypothetical protein VKK79_06650 [Candidatus Lokiarchaeia archaeon]|nr:hypothetical protein [Candidatus Lokiarchaeia archaeon]